MDAKKTQKRRKSALGVAGWWQGASRGLFIGFRDGGEVEGWGCSGNGHFFAKQQRVMVGPTSGAAVWYYKRGDFSKGQVGIVLDKSDGEGVWGYGGKFQACSTRGYNNAVKILRF